MSEMNKENFDKNFEQQWQDAFEGAELSPKIDMWDKIEAQLASPTHSTEAGKYGYLFSWGLLLFLGGFFIQKTVPVSASKHSNTLTQASSRAGVPTKASNMPVQTSSETHIEKNLPTQHTFEAASNPIPQTQAQSSYMGTAVIREARTYSPEAPNTLPTKQTNLPTQTADKQDSMNFGREPLKVNFIKRATQELRRKIQEVIKQSSPAMQENAVEALQPLAMRFPKISEIKAQEIHTVIYPEVVPPTVYLKNFWIGVQRGVTLSPTKLEIHYDRYLADYAKVHQLTDGVNLSDFFTEVEEKAHYSIANQGDIRFGYHFSPRWQFMTGIQYRMEFLEQTTNAFFVNYYDYTRHSFLLDILEGNIQNPNFAQALQNHPTYSPNGANNFTISQFNQKGSIHISSRFEYISIPMQVGYTLRPFKKLGFTILGGAQVDKLTRSNTSSYELKDDVATTYKLNTASKISTWSWQIGGGIQAEYHFNTRWALTANSILFQNIKSIKENKYVEVRPRGLQINMGTKYMF